MNEAPTTVTSEGGIYVERLKRQGTLTAFDTYGNLCEASGLPVARWMVSIIDMKNGYGFGPTHEEALADMYRRLGVLPQGTNPSG